MRSLAFPTLASHSFMVCWTDSILTLTSRFDLASSSWFWWLKKPTSRSARAISIGLRADAPPDLSVTTILPA